MTCIATLRQWTIRLAYSLPFLVKPICHQCPSGNPYSPNVSWCWCFFIRNANISAKFPARIKGWYRLLWVSQPRRISWKPLHISAAYFCSWSRQHIAVVATSPPSRDTEWLSPSSVSLKEGSPSRREAGPVRWQPASMARMVWPVLQHSDAASLSDVVKLS